MELQFAEGLTGKVIYDPLRLSGGAFSAGPIAVTISNLSVSDYAHLGFYLRAASDVGDVDNPANYSPSTDYQDLLTWGSETTEGLQSTGGLIISFTDSLGNPITQYFRRGVGSLYSNKIFYGVLASGSSFTATFELEVPSDAVTRRLFIDIVAQ